MGLSLDQAVQAGALGLAGKTLTDISAQLKAAIAGGANIESVSIGLSAGFNPIILSQPLDVSVSAGIVMGLTQDLDAAVAGITAQLASLGA